MTSNELETYRFRVPFEETQPSIEALLTRAWPGVDADAIEAIVERGRLEVSGRAIRQLDHVPRPEGEVVVEMPSLEAEAREMPEPSLMVRGDDWVVVDKPVGTPGRPDPDDPMHPLLFLADSLGIDRRAFTPVWPMPTRAGGPWLFAPSPEAASALRHAWRSGDLMTTWVALVPRPEMPSGTLRSSDEVRIEYSAATMREGLAELQLTPRWSGPSPDDSETLPTCSLPEVLLDTLADAGWPVLGDRRRGGYMVTGGLRLQLAALFRPDTDLQHSWQPEDDWWPDEPVRTPPEQRETEDEHPLDAFDLPTIVLTRDAFDRMQQTEHPWIPIGGELDLEGALRPGTLAQIRDVGDRVGPIVLFENTSGLLARRWSDDPLEATEVEGEIERRVDEAVARRTPLLRRADRIEQFRLVHGEADGLPGFYLDRFGPILRAVPTSLVCRGFKQTVYENLARHDPESLIVEIEDTPEGSADAEERFRLVSAAESYLEIGSPLVLREGELRYRCNPWTLEADAFEAAHRPHRDALAERADADQRWLLACPAAPGFAVVLVARGAEVVDVGSTEEGEAWIGETLELNDLDADRYRPSAQTFGDEIDGFASPVDGIVLALGGGDSGEEPLRRALSHVQPGGTLLAYRVERRPSSALDEELNCVADKEGVRLEQSETIDVPIDVPSLPDFPEGDPYQSVLADVAKRARD